MANWFSSRRRTIFGNLYIRWEKWGIGNSKNFILDGKQKIPRKCKIGNTCFKYVAVIGGRLFRNSAKNNNHVHKDEKDFLSVIMILGKNVSGGGTVIYDGVRIYNLGLKAHILKHLHGRCISGPF